MKTDYIQNIKYFWLSTDLSLFLKSTAKKKAFLLNHLKIPVVCKERLFWM